jgi:antitoxin component YwqK of YwqJK toxin-antitoxin module
MRDKKPRDANDYPHGLWEMYHTNGQLYTGEYIHGKMHGAWTGYNPDGGVWFKENHDRGKLIGYYVHYKYDGKLSHKRFYAR